MVFGAGLIGGFVAGAMISQGLNVALVARSSVRQKLSAGLRLTDYQDHEAIIDSVSFVDTDKLLGAPSSHSCDYLWLTVKCTAVESALAELPALVGPSTIIFCVQNGLGSEQIVKDRFPANKVMRVMAMFNVAEPSPGHLHRGSQGHLGIEELDDYPEIARDIATHINSPLMVVDSCDHIVALLWAKLQLNLANAVNALADGPIKNMIEQRNYRRVIALLMKELLAVVDAMEISLPKVTPLPAHWVPEVLSLPNCVFRIVGQKMLAVDPTVRTSMWWDLSGGKQTEVEFLNGALIRAGKEVGVACPANEKLLAMIHQAEQKELEQGIDAESFLEALRL